MNKTTAKILRIAAVVLMGLTAAINLLGGAGTTCAAFLTERFASMAPILPFQWLYQALVITTVPLGVAGIWATVNLVRGKPGALKQALILLVIGVVLGAIHMGASLALRGKAVPANVKLYLNGITLFVFLLFLLPGVRKFVDFSRPSGARNIEGGLAAIVAGVVILSTALWAGPSHTVQGENWVHVLIVPLMIVGTLSTSMGLGMLGLAVWRAPEAAAPDLDRQLV